MADKLGIYIHIPFCRSKCDYCDFYSLAGREDQMDRYQKALLAHLKETAPLAQGYPVTPSTSAAAPPATTGPSASRSCSPTWPSCSRWKRTRRSPWSATRTAWI